MSIFELAIQWSEEDIYDHRIMMDFAQKEDDKRRVEIARMIFEKKGWRAALRYCERNLEMKTPEDGMAEAVSTSWMYFIDKVTCLLEEGNIHNASWCYYKQMPKYANHAELHDYGFETWLGVRPGLDDFISFEPEIAPAFWHFLRERAQKRSQ